MGELICASPNEIKSEGNLATLADRVKYYSPDWETTFTIPWVCHPVLPNFIDNSTILLPFSLESTENGTELIKAFVASTKDIEIQNPIEYNNFYTYTLHVIARRMLQAQGIILSPQEIKDRGIYLVLANPQTSEYRRRSVVDNMTEHYENQEYLFRPVGVAETVAEFVTRYPELYKRLIHFYMIDILANEPPNNITTQGYQKLANAVREDIHRDFNKDDNDGPLADEFYRALSVVEKQAFPAILGILKELAQDNRFVHELGNLTDRQLLSLLAR